MGFEEVDQALRRLERMLAPRLGPGPTRAVLRNLFSIRESANATPLIALQAIHSVFEAFHARPEAGVPWPMPVGRAIREAAARKLPVLSHRLGFGMPARGIGPHDAEALLAHREALVPAFSFGGLAEEAEARAFAEKVALLNALSYQHHLVFGEPTNRNDPEPIFALAAAAEAQGLLSSEGGSAYVPITLFREVGVIWAIGPELPADPAARWRPDRHLFVPLRGGRSLALEERPDLLQLIGDYGPPITPATLASLIHLLSLPFPFEARITLPERALLDRFVPLEAAIEDGRALHDELEEIEELVLRVDPPGTELRYRRRRLTFERTSC